MSELRVRPRLPGAKLVAQRKSVYVAILGALALVSTLFAAPVAEARITKIDITSAESPTFAGTTFGTVGAYEKLHGKTCGEVDPADLRNALITDIGHAPLNSDGKLECSMDIYILKPIDLSHGNNKRPSYEYIVFDNPTTLTSTLAYAAATLDRTQAALTVRQHLTDSVVAIRWIPFETTKAERKAAGDPRPSLEERYKDHDDYVKKVAKAAKDLEKRRFPLPADVPRHIDRAQRSNVLLPLGSDVRAADACFQHD